MPMILRDIAAALSAPIEGDGSIEITGITDPAHASGSSDLALAMTRESVPALAHTKARAVIVTPKVAAAVDRFDAVIKVEHPRLALAVLTRLFERPVHRGTGIHPTAVISSDAKVDDRGGTEGDPAPGAGSSICLEFFSDRTVIVWNFFDSQRPPDVWVFTP